MKRAVILALFFAACASQKQSSGPQVAVKLSQINAGSNTFYIGGPVNVQYQVAVSNPTNQEVTLRRLELRTEGLGAYELPNQGYPMKVKVAPKSTATFTINAWGQARGGYMAAGEPVSLFANAYFDSPSGTFTKLVHENAWQP